jgi:hypothetical protein
MATLSVGGTTVFDGAALQSGVTGSPALTLTTAATFPAGHIVQVVEATKNDATNYSNTTAPGDTILTKAITITSTNKVLIHVSLSINQQTSYGGFWSILRDSTVIYPDVGSRTPTNVGHPIRSAFSAYIFEQQGVTILDTPAVATPTYTVKCFTTNAGDVVRVNRTISEDSNSGGQSSSHIVLSEVQV